MLMRNSTKDPSAPQKKGHAFCWAKAQVKLLIFCHRLKPMANYDGRSHAKIDKNLQLRSFRSSIQVIDFA